MEVMVNQDNINKKEELEREIKEGYKKITDLSVDELREMHSLLERRFRLKKPVEQVIVHSKYNEVLEANSKFRGLRKKGYSVDLHNIAERISSLYLEDYLHTYAILVYMMEVIEDALKEGESVIFPKFMGISGTLENPIFMSFNEITKARANGNTNYKGDKNYDRKSDNKGDF